MAEVCDRIRMGGHGVTGDRRSQRERMLAGDLYRADDPELEAGLARAAALADRFHRETLAGDPAAAGTLADLVGSLGPGVTVRPPLFVDYGINLHLGAATFVNVNLTALDAAPIHVGAHCQIGPNVQLLTPLHPMDPQTRRDKLESAEPITIGDNVWLAGGVIVCPGVTIGDNAVIGAGSVVTRDVPADAVALGSPARVRR